MGNFSDVLTKIMERKGSVNNEVIRYTGINRSTFFKIKNGKRNPSGTEMVDSIVNALRLNEEDRRILVEAYEIDQIGEYKYYGMKAIQDFFMSKARHSETPPALISIPEFQKDEHIRIFRDTSEVSVAITGMLHEESNRILIMENRMSDIYTVGIPLASRARPEKEFVHIFMMDDTDTVGINHQLYNVNCFRNVAEIMTKAVRYSPRYCYQPVSLLEKSARPTNFILSDRYFLTYSETLESAILCDDSAVIKLFTDIFSEYLGHSKTYAETVDLTKAIRMEKFLSNFDEVSHDVYCFCPGFCIPLGVEDNDDFVNKYIRDDFPGKEEYTRYYRLYRESFRKRVEKLGDSCHVISASNALENFARTGYVNEFPRQFAAPFDKEGRTAVLRQWDRIVKAYNIQTIREKCIPDTSSLVIFASDRNAIVILVNEEQMKSVQICINETGIVELLCAYLEKLEKESAMTNEEYREFMDSLIAGMIG